MYRERGGIIYADGYFFDEVMEKLGDAPAKLKFGVINFVWHEEPYSELRILDKDGKCLAELKFSDWTYEEMVDYMTKTMVSLNHVVPIEK